MEKQLEIEFKTMINKNEYDLLNETLFASELSIRQSNFYFDDQNKSLYKQNKMVRIRQIDTSFLFTLKTPLELGVLEEEIELEDLNIKDNKLTNLFQSLDIKQENLEVISISHTTRKEKSDCFGTWCLDYNTFESHIDYELEYELHPEVNYEEALEHFHLEFKKLNITFKKAKPKYIRALESQIA